MCFDSFLAEILEFYSGKNLKILFFMKSFNQPFCKISSSKIPSDTCNKATEASIRVEFKTNLT